MEETIQAVINSYLSHLRWCNAYRLRKDVCERVKGSVLGSVLVPSEDFKKVTIRPKYTKISMYYRNYRELKETLKNHIVMKTKYGKIVCGALRVPQNYPDYIEDASGKKIVNPTEEQMAAAGYLPIVTKKPTKRAGKVAVPSYALNADGTKIIQSWNYEPEPDQQPTDESN